MKSMLLLLLLTPGAFFAQKSGSSIIQIGRFSAEELPILTISADQFNAAISESLPGARYSNLAIRRGTDSTGSPFYYLQALAIDEKDSFQVVIPLELSGAFIQFNPATSCEMACVCAAQCQQSPELFVLVPCKKIRCQNQAPCVCSTTRIRFPGER